MTELKEEIEMNLRPEDIGEKEGDEKEFILLDVKPTMTKFGKRYVLHLKDEENFRWRYWVTEKEMADIYKKLRIEGTYGRKVKAILYQKINIITKQPQLKIRLEVIQ